MDEFTQDNIRAINTLSGMKMARNSQFSRLLKKSLGAMLTAHSFPFSAGC
jgi:hypothetical protein